MCGGHFICSAGRLLSIMFMGRFNVRDCVSLFASCKKCLCQHVAAYSSPLSSWPTAGTMRTATWIGGCRRFRGVVAVDLGTGASNGCWPRTTLSEPADPGRWVT